jgi:hypothetical protein
VPRRRLCVFCRKRESKLTVEDVLPSWLLRYWEWQKFPTSPVTGVWTNLGTGKEIRRPVALKVAASIVCTTCNSTWMSDIQREASDRLKPMLAGHSIVLNADDQRWLAVWWFMTACTWEFTSPRRYIPQSKRSELFRLRTRVPSTTHMWIGHVVTKSRLATFSTGPIDVVSEPDRALARRHNAYFATIHFGNLITQFAGHTVKSQDVRVDRVEASPLFWDIWPPLLPSIAWPPRWSMDDRGLDGALRAFIRNPWINV